MMIKVLSRTHIPIFSSFVFLSSFLKTHRRLHYRHQQTPPKSHDFIAMSTPEKQPGVPLLPTTSPITRTISDDDSEITTPSLGDIIIVVMDTFVRLTNGLSQSLLALVTLVLVVTAIDL